MAIAVRAGRAQAFGRAGHVQAPVRAPAAGPKASPPLDEPAAKPAPAVATGLHVGFMTLGLMAVLIAIYAYEMRLSGSTGDEINEHYFVALGGVNGSYLFAHHEWWRAFTSAWLHASNEHIIGNGIALVITGWLLERLIGRAWLLAAYVFGALGGCAGSLALTPMTVGVGLGASGAIMALVALLFTVSFHTSLGEKAARRYRVYALVTLIPAMLPSVSADGAVDIGAHFGGAIAGTAFGFFLLAIWPDDSNARPPFALAAGATGMLGLVATAFAFIAMLDHFPAYAADARQFAPTTMIIDSEKKDQTAELVTAYPHDPQAHLARAIHLYKMRDMTGALGEIRAGLDAKHALAIYYPPETTFNLRLFLVLGLLGEERADDARTEAHDICPIIRDPARWPGGTKSALAEPIGYVRDSHICD